MVGGSGGAKASGPRARTSLGVRSGAPERLLDLELAEAGGHALAVEHGDLVVGHLADGPAATVSEHQDPTVGLEPRHRLQGRTPEQAADGAGELGRRGAGRRVDRDLVATQRRASRRRARQLQRPAPRVAALAEAVAECDGGADQAQVGGIEVGGVEALEARLGDGHPVGEVAQVGELEARPGPELDLALEVRGRVTHWPRPDAPAPG